MNNTLKKTSIGIAITTILISGCATQETAIHDTSNLNPTNVLDVSYVISGFIIPDSRGSQAVYTRNDRRRIDQTIEYDSWISSKLLGDTDTSQIARLDKNLEWHIDKKRKEYVECPLGGCNKNIWDTLNNNQDTSSNDQHYDPTGGEHCNIQTTSFDFNVTAQAKNRSINGFTANQYTAQWNMVAKDENNRSDKHILRMDFWMVEPTQEMNAGLKMNTAFQEGYLDKLGAKTNPLSRYFSEKIYKAIAMVSGDIEKSEIPHSSPVVKQLNEIPGFPVSIKLEWFADSNACPDSQNPTPESELSFDIENPTAAISGFASKFMKKKAKALVKNTFSPDPNSPVFSYIYDVKSSQIKDERDSIFEIPHKHKLVDRK